MPWRRISTVHANLGDHSGHGDTWYLHVLWLAPSEIQPSVPTIAFACRKPVFAFPDDALTYPHDRIGMPVDHIG
jgi:hypothetical protein